MTRFSPFEGPWAFLRLIHAVPGPVFEIEADPGRRRLLLKPGQPPRDVGPWPLPEGPWPNFSDDGRRGVVATSDLRTDIWLLRWGESGPEHE